MKPHSVNISRQRADVKIGVNDSKAGMRSWILTRVIRNATFFWGKQGLYVPLSASSIELLHIEVCVRPSCGCVEESFVDNYDLVEA